MATGDGEQHDESLQWRGGSSPLTTGGPAGAPSIPGLSTIPDRQSFRKGWALHERRIRGGEMTTASTGHPKLRGSSQVLYVGIVAGTRAIHFLAASGSRDSLERQLADYVAANADVQLGPESARRIHALLETEQPTAAIDAYFAVDAKRWDEERLFIHELPFPAGSSGAYV